MILGLGSDIVENERIASIYKNHKERFLNRLYTRNEIEYCLSHSDPIPYLSARFAVKEATIKALNLQGGQGFSWKNIEVYGKGFGKKKLLFHAKVAKIIESMNVSQQHLSLSHSDNFSMAVVILEG